MTLNSTWSGPSAARATRGGLALIGFGLAAVLLAGCKQELHCQELGDCGGPVPIGNWTLGETPEKTFASCAEDLYIPPTDKRLVGADLPPARIPAPEPAFSDWCGGLIASTSKVLYATPLFYTESSPVGAATVRYNADGTYAVGFGLVGTYLLSFSAACMRQFGATDGKPAPGPGGAQPDADAPLVDVCKQLEVPLRESGINEGAYRNTTCTPDPKDPGGCACYFDRAEVFGSAGNYALISSNEILHTPSTPNFPYRVVYCTEGNTLQLTAADGSYLFGLPGLRTLDLGRLDCADGLQGLGEEGPDCGFACGNVCPGAAPAP